jgi:hypothetical protein
VVVVAPESLAVFLAEQPARPAAVSAMATTARAGRAPEGSRRMAASYGEDALPTESLDYRLDFRPMVTYE